MTPARIALCLGFLFGQSLPAADVPAASHPAARRGPSVDLYRELIRDAEYYPWVMRLDHGAGLSDDQLERIRAFASPLANQLRELRDWKTSRNRAINTPGLSPHERAALIATFGHESSARERSLPDVKEFVEDLLTPEQLVQYKEFVLRTAVEAELFPVKLTADQWRQLREPIGGSFAIDVLPGEELSRLLEAADGILTTEQRAAIDQDRRDFGDRPREPLVSGHFLPGGGIPGQLPRIVSVPRLLQLMSPYLVLSAAQQQRVVDACETLAPALEAAGYTIPAWHTYHARFSTAVRSVLTPSQLAYLRRHWPAYASARLNSRGPLSLTSHQQERLETLARTTFDEPAECPGNFPALYDHFFDRLYPALTVDQKLALLPADATWFSPIATFTWSEQQERQIDRIRRDVLTDGTPRRLYTHAVRYRVLSILTPRQSEQLSAGLAKHAIERLLGQYQPAKLTDDQKAAMEHFCRDLCSDLPSVFRVADHLDSDEQRRYNVHLDVVPRLYAMTRVLLTPSQRAIMDEDKPLGVTSDTSPVKP